MAKNKHKTIIFRFVAGLTIIFLFGAMLFPAIAETLESDCDDCDDCNDHGKSVCGCFGCPPVTLAYEMPLPDYSPVLNVLAYNRINISNDFKCDFFDRLDRPPRHSSTSHL